MSDDHFDEIGEKIDYESIDVLEEPKIEEESKEEEPKVEEPKVKKEKKQSKKKKKKISKPVVKNRTLDIVKGYVDQYRNYIDKHDRVNAIKSFSNIVLYLNNKFNSKACDYVIEEFKKEKKILLNHRVALQGIENLPAGTRIKIETFYILLKQILNKKTSILKIDFDKVRSFFGNQEMTNYFIKKCK